MDISFHYYIGCVIAYAAGFSYEDAITIAHSAQYVDDNRDRYFVCSQILYEFLTYCTDMMSNVDERDMMKCAFLCKDMLYDFNNKLKACKNVLSDVYISCLTQSYKFDLRDSSGNHVYLPYHFIPGGEQQCKFRADFVIERLCVAPGSNIATLCLRNALGARDKYRIGVASHAYCDTWAHQNFCGIRDKFNIANSWLKYLYQYVPSRYWPLGHVDVLNKPDEIGGLWYDFRLKESKVCNFERFYHAARSLFFEYGYSMQETRGDIVKRWSKLSVFIRDALNGGGDINEKCDQYMRSIAGRGIIKYDAEAWSRSALEIVQNCIKGKGGGNKLSRILSLFRDISFGREKILCAKGASCVALYALLKNFDGFESKFAVWRDYDNDMYREKDWYKFQKGAFAHNDDFWRLFAKFDL